MRPFSATLTALLLSTALGGCATSVPRQAVELSLAIDERLSAVQSSHETFVVEYFAATRARVDDFMHYRWMPTFLETYVRDSGIVDLVGDPQASDAERGATMLEFSEAALEEIDRQRESLLAPLRSQERLALKELRATYAELAAMNATITAHLQAQNDVSEMQEATLRRLRLLEERDAVLGAVTDVNRAIERVLASSESVDVIRGEIEAILHGTEQD